MYQFLVSFTVQPEHRDDFIRQPARPRATLSRTSPAPAGSSSSRTGNPDLFYLDEVYTDADAFNAHASGPYFGAFFAEASTYAEGPTWLVRGTSSATRPRPKSKAGILLPHREAARMIACSCLDIRRQLPRPRTREDRSSIGTPARCTVSHHSTHPAGQQTGEAA
jgi:(4S)-4-hydroxy-5-phosphonooxypentane-2,3-dione isomerase